MKPRGGKSAGFTLVEVLIAIAISAVLMAGLSAAMRVGTDASRDARARNELSRDAHFAMERMFRAVSRSSDLLLPLPANPGTAQQEEIRDPGVLSVSLDPQRDRDQDGFADADNDQDGRVDEDWGSDINGDGDDGIVGVDDDGDGSTDENAAFDSAGRDDDEDGFHGEDEVDGGDDDDDGDVDEDPSADLNGDSSPGFQLVDDDGDGSIDEGNQDDDDEDGVQDEDWIDSVSYFLAGNALVERHPDLNPADGTAWTERTIAENVTQFRVERLPRGDDRAALVDLTLELRADGAAVLVQTRVRVGGGL